MEVSNERPMTEEITSAMGDYDEAAISLEVAGIVNPATCPKVVDLTPHQAGFIYLRKNMHNRDLSESRVGEYQRAMERGEWKANHQGIAFYETGELADGQHRCAAIALSGVAVPVLIYAGFEKDAIQTIDQVKARTAGEALKMEGISDGNIKSSLMKSAMVYVHLNEHGTQSRYTVVQVIKSVNDNDAALNACLEKADYLLSSVTDSPMKRGDVALHAFLMTQHGGYQMEKACEFLSAVLTGVAPYEGAPQLVLSRILTRAKHGAKQADRLSGIARNATIQKAVKLWAEEQKCSKLVWSKKEGFPLSKAD